MPERIVHTRHIGEVAVRIVESGQPIFTIPLLFLPQEAELVQYLSDNTPIIVRAVLIIPVVHVWMTDVYARIVA